MARIEIGKYTGTVVDDPSGTQIYTVDVSQPFTFGVTAYVTIKKDGSVVYSKEWLAMSLVYTYAQFYIGESFNDTDKPIGFIRAYMQTDSEGYPIEGTLDTKKICFVYINLSDYVGDTIEVSFMDEEQASPAVLQEKAVTVSADTVVYPDEGYDGLSSVAITVVSGSGERFDIDSYTIDDFPYKNSFTADWTSEDSQSYFDIAKDFVATYFYGVLNDLIYRINVPTEVQDKKARMFVANAIAWYLTDFYGSEMGATAPTTGLLPISQKNIGGVFVGFASTQTQQAIKALESNKFGILVRDQFYAFKERLAIYL